MNFKRPSPLFFSMFSLLWASPLLAAPLDLSGESAVIERSTLAEPLRPASAQDPLDVIQTHLAEQGVREETLHSLEVMRTNYVPRTGRTHYWLVQRVHDMPVRGTYVKATFSEDGALLSVIRLLQALPSEQTLLEAEAATLVSPQSALLSAVTGLYSSETMEPVLLEKDGNVWRFAPSPLFSEPLTVERLWLPQSDGTLLLGYQVQTWDKANLLRHTLVDGAGALQDVQERTAFDTYLIFPEDPDKGEQLVADGPGEGNAFAPQGWVYGDTTTGNNVDAYLDTNNDNSPDMQARPSSQRQEFVLPFDLKTDPSEGNNPLAAVQNLFYLTNSIHDLLYAHGFTEDAGNFQNDNFGRGGLGEDALNAEAQDGGGTNNANFATPEDGQRPRMQMYLWTPSEPRRDGALDSDIVYHEYGHGLTWRMIGDMSGPLAGALGEGMSDALAIILNEQDTVAEYANNNALGIRRAPYEGYPLTYRDVTGKSVHNDGEIYAAALWRLQRLWQDYGLDKPALLELVVDGMNYTPSQPSYENMRDGLLTAASEDRYSSCLVWEAFAHFGMGVGSKGVMRGLGQFRRAVITESYVIPDECN